LKRGGFVGWARRGCLGFNVVVRVKHEDMTERLPCDTSTWGFRFLKPACSSFAVFTAISSHYGWTVKAWFWVTADAAASLPDTFTIAA